MKDTIAIAGSLAQKPNQGGHSWVLLQYLLGFKRLGWNVLFLDQLEPAMYVNGAGEPCRLEESSNLRYFLKVMEGFGLDRSYAIICDRGERLIGLSRRQVLDRLRNSAFLLNVMGFLTDEELLAQTPRRVFLDIDPGFGQMWHDLSLCGFLRGHHTYVTIGENIGLSGCLIPTCGLNWLTTRQPVVLDCWPLHPPPQDGCFTGIATWRGAYGPVQYHGRTYGLRVHEFRKFVRVPLLSGRVFQLALNIHPADEKDTALLLANGWRLVEPKRAAGDPWAYRAFIQGSKAEFMVAKHIYVVACSGWFSDRTICYLATGRPVVVQDTGFKQLYPTGRGLLAFTTLEEAVAGVEEISGDYDRHARAARAIAEEYFHSDIVLSRLLAKLGVA